MHRLLFVVLSTPAAVSIQTTKAEILKMEDI
jgi:hypothetical protein